jgi:transposase
MAMEIAVLGIDLGKNSCSVVGLDGSGAVILRRRLHRESVIKVACGLAPGAVCDGNGGMLWIAPPRPHLA